MEDRIDVTVSMPKALVDLIDEQLGYGDSRARWNRDAAREKLQRDGVDLPKEAFEGPYSEWEGPSDENPDNDELSADEESASS